MAHAIKYELQGIPDWQVSSDRRLKVTMLLAAVLVTAVLSLFRMPTAGEPAPLVELVVRMIEQVAESPAAVDVQAESEPDTESVSAPVPIEEAQAPPTAPADAGLLRFRPVPDAAELSLPIEIRIVEDWREFGRKIVQEFVARLQPPPTVNPVFDEKRRVAAVKFRPSEAPARLEPWDKVEKDQIGRTILQLSNGCFQVIDDPSAVYRDVFETYTQFVVQCTIGFGKRKGQELPWVDEIRQRYAYLRRREQQRRDPTAF
ncbi:MAG: hypothetical protein ACI88G_000530 [Woeseiaceae bacterium]|jgi:hypothetical protein